MNKEIKIPTHKILATYLANLMAAEYNEWLGMLFKENKLNYLSNKLEAAYKAEEKVMAQLTVVDKGMKAELEKAKDFHSSLMFDVFRLDDSDQQRVRSLVDKIKKHEKYETS